MIVTFLSGMGKARMSEELKQELHEWIYKTGCNKKFSVYFHDYPEVNEGLDLLIKIHDAWNTRAEPRCDRCTHYNHSMCECCDQLVMKDFYCKHFEPSGKSG